MQNQRQTYKQSRARQQKCILCGVIVPAGDDVCKRCDERLDEVLFGKHPGFTEQFFETATEIYFSKYGEASPRQD